MLPMQKTPAFKTNSLDSLLKDMECQFQNNNFKKGLEIGLSLADGGNYNFYRPMRKIVLDGTGDQQRQFFAHTLEAATKDSATAWLILAQYYYLGKVTERDLSQTINCIKQAYKFGSCTSYIVIGCQLYTEQLHHKFIKLGDEKSAQDMKNLRSTLLLP